MKPEENKFRETMSGKSTDELKKILSMKSEYQPEAIQAAQDEMAFRDNIQESEKSILKDGDDFLFLKKVKSFSNDELIKFHDENYLTLLPHEVPILNNELKQRSIEPKAWYFTKSNEKKGPYSASEMKEFASKGDIDHYDFVWKNGLKNWIEAKDVKGLFKEETIPPRIKKEKPAFVNTGKTLTAGIILASVLLFLTSLFWLVFGILQVGFSAIDNELGNMGIWNILVSLACIGFGIGILMRKKWGYNWGLGTALINAIIFGYNFLFVDGSFFILLMLLLDTLTVILLYANRERFKDKAENVAI